MAASRNAEENVYQAAKAGLKRWLVAARNAVMAPFRDLNAQPAADAVYATVPLWQNQVDRILAALTPALREGWTAAHLPGELSINDPYIQANLAMTHNLLVRIPDETHAKIVAIILDGANKGQSNVVIAGRIDDLLTYEGQENWDGRAKLIAQTETTRSFSASMVAHGLLVERQDGVQLAKKWIAHDDNRTRTSHMMADGQVRRLSEPFDVGPEGNSIQMQFPGDPSAPADEVCGCRCWPKIVRLKS